VIESARVPHYLVEAALDELATALQS
jgi:hypothetical protein